MSESSPHGFTRFDNLDEARALRSPGRALPGLVAGARGLAERIRASGPVVSVRTFDLATFPYPTRFAFADAAFSPAPFAMLRNRMQLVQVQAPGPSDGQSDGPSDGQPSGNRPLNVLINPGDSERSLAAPFFARQIERYGPFLSRRVLSERHGTVVNYLRSVGVAPEDIDYIIFDHLHVQDLRGLLGTDAPEPGRSRSTPALLPNARLLAQVEELDTLAELHPLHAEWYVRDGLLGVAPEKIVALAGDYLIGPGLALIRTPGHTAGNHTPVIMTERGLWTISENGVAVDSYAPGHSRIAGLARHARTYGVEAILNANTREHTLAQYTSMMVEKAIADPCPDRPEFPQHFPSSELTPSYLAPGLGSTYRHGHITHGRIVPSS